MARYIKESNFKKSYIPVILTAVMLVVLVLGLGYVIFFMNEKSTLKGSMYAESLGNYKIKAKIQALAKDEVVDVILSSNNLETTEDNQFKDKEIKVENYVNNEFLDKNIMLGGSKTKMADNDLLIYSGEGSPSAYVSILSLNGKTKWIYDLGKNVSVIDAFYINNNVNVFYKENNVVKAIIINSNGKSSKPKEICNLQKKSIKIIYDNNRFIYFLYKDNIMDVFEFNKDLKNKKKITSLSSYINDYFLEGINDYSISSFNNKIYFLYETYGSESSFLVAMIIDENNKIEYKKIDMVIGANDNYELYQNILYIYNKIEIKTLNLDDLTTENVEYNFEMDTESEIHPLLDENCEYSVENEDFFDETTTYDYFVIDDIFLNNKERIMALENYNYYGFDLYKNNKIIKRVFFEKSEEKAGYYLNFAVYNNKHLYLIYYFGNSNIYINKYEVGE